MKGFLNKRSKSYGATEDSRPSEEIPIPPVPNTAHPPLTTKKSWRKKKNQPDAKPEFNLATALPSSDDFRTSLIMPNLSARFSMLKEQSDPNSLLGKASDDSVLSSNRRSRYADLLAPTQLSDIAEVQSIKDSRPTFIRQGSYNEGFTTDEESTYSGSIMSRARPGEGNVLFGGRQKIYKIPIGDAGSVRNLGTNESRGMRGRALYEDDVITSDFQRLREKERQLERERRLAELEREAEADSLSKDEMRSPSLSLYDEKRDTTSSTNSGPSMISASTAPTSVANSVPSSSPSLPPLGGQPSGPPRLERSNSRRLYEQGLDQHMSEAQAAAMAKMSSIQRKNSLNGRMSPHRLFQSRSATNLNDRYDRNSPGSSGAASPVPPPSEKLTTFDSIRDGRSGGNTPNSANALSPPWSSHGNDVLTHAIDEQDRGKATAMSAFSRPKQFDEQQYLARQRSLHQQQRSPRLEPTNAPKTRGSPPNAPKTRGSPPNGKPRMSPIKQKQRPSPEAYYASARKFDGRPSEEGRSRATSNQTDRSWSASSNARNMSNTPQSTSRPTTAGQKESSPAEESPIPSSPEAFVLPRPSDDESRLSDDAPSDFANGAKPSFERGTSRDLPRPLRNISEPKMEEHPALRTEQSPTPTKEKRHAWSPSRGNTPIMLPEAIFTPQIAVEEQPDLKDTAEEDAKPTSDEHAPMLAGLVREHLRQPSNVSSIYPSSPNRSSFVEPNDDFDQKAPVTYVQPGNPWDEDVLRGEVGVTNSIKGGQPIPGDRPPPSPRTIESPSDAAEWMRELRLKHEREVSSETQQEREAFADELAQRQRAIQENLKVKTDTAQKTPIAPVNKGNFENGKKTFGMLRSRPSREAMNQQDSPNKAMRMFGMSGGGPGPALSNAGQSEGLRKPSMENLQSPPMGRTLHMRMQRPSFDSPGQSPGPSPRPSRDPSRDGPRQRQNSLASDRYGPFQRTPPDSSRTSTSQDRPIQDFSHDRPYQRYGGRGGPPAMHSSNNSGFMNSPSFTPRGSPKVSMGRNEFVGPDGITRPSVESQRFRSASSSSMRQDMPMGPPPGRPRPAAPPAVRTRTAPERAPALSTSEINSSAGPSPPYSAPASPPEPVMAAPTPPFAMGINMAGQTNTSLSQISSYNGTPPSPASATGQNPQDAPKTLPPSTFTFPMRTAAQRPSSNRTTRSPTITKGDISDPVLISATSSMDTVPLPGGASLRNTGDVDLALEEVFRSRQNSLAKDQQQENRSRDQSPSSAVLSPAPMSAPLPISTNLASSTNTSDLPTPPASASALRKQSTTSSFLKSFRNRNNASPLPPDDHSTNTSPRAESPMFGNAFAINAAAASAAATSNSRGNTPSPAPLPSTASQTSTTSFFGRKSSAATSPIDQEEDDFVTRPSGGRFRMRKVSNAAPGQKHEAVWAGLVEGRDGLEGSGRGRGIVE